MGQSSTVSGYASGGSPGGTGQTTIDKFPFATDSNATDVADLFQGARYGSGSSSTVSGYVAGTDSPVNNTIQKFSFASDQNGTDVGDLVTGVQQVTGQQY